MSDNSKKGWRILSWVGGGIALILRMIYMGGFFTPNKIGPGNRPCVSGKELIPEQTGLAAGETITEYYEFLQSTAGDAMGRRRSSLCY